MSEKYDVLGELRDMAERDSLRRAMATNGPNKTKTHCGRIKGGEYERPQPCFLYLIRFRDTGLYKIGITSKPSKRFFVLSRCANGSTTVQHDGPERKITVIGIVFCETRNRARWMEDYFSKKLWSMRGATKEFVKHVPEEVKDWFWANGIKPIGMRGMKSFRKSFEKFDGKLADAGWDDSIVIA